MSTGSVNTIPAAEIKRRGVVALEEGLKKGLLHIIKGNRPICVVLSEKDYAALLMKTKSVQAVDLWNLLDNRTWQGHRSKKDIDAQIKNERGNWDKTK